jgi:hypothetical protein
VFLKNNTLKTIGKYTVGGKKWGIVVQGLVWFKHSILTGMIKTNPQWTRNRCLNNQKEEWKTHHVKCTAVTGAGVKKKVKMNDYSWSIFSTMWICKIEMCWRYFKKEKGVGGTITKGYNKCIYGNITLEYPVYQGIH